jgi:carbon monoxide dehydrogenase subunit G
MIIETGFAVGASSDRVLSALTDPDVVVACLPGARIRETQENGTVVGDLSLPVGKAAVGYRGELIIRGLDSEAGAINLESAGREIRGKGTWMVAAALRLRESAGSTTVSMQIDVDVTGRAQRAGDDAVRSAFEQLVAQFGGALSERLEGEPASGTAEVPASPVSLPEWTPPPAVSLPAVSLAEEPAIRGRVEVVTDGALDAAGIPIGDGVVPRAQALHRDRPWAIPAVLLTVLALVLLLRRRRR